MPYRIELPPDIAKQVGKDAVEGIPDDVKPEQVKAQLLAKFGQQAREMLGPIPKDRPIIPELAAMAPTLIPGEGLALAAARPALSAGIRYAGEKLAGGKEPGMAAAMSGAEMLGGEVLGGVGRAITRTAKSAWDRTIPELMDAIVSAAPEFGGAKTASGVVNRIIGGEGMAAAGEAYASEMVRLFKAFGDPPVLGIKGQTSASQATREIRDGLRKAYKAGNTAEVARLEGIRDQIDQEVSKVWPQEAFLARDEIKRQYAAHKEIANWFAGGDKKISKTGLEALIPPEGKALDVSTLQALFGPRRQSLQRVMRPEEYSAIESALRQSAETTARDVAGQGLSIGGHIGPTGVHPYVRHLPRAPRMAQEGPAPEVVAQALRALGVGGAAGIVEPDTFGEIAKRVAP